MTYYLGLDLSLSETGVVLLNNKHIAEEAFVIKTSAKTPVYARAEHVLSEILSVIPSLPTHIFIEGYAMGAKGQLFTIAEFSGIIKHTLWRKCLDCTVFLQIPPTSLKKFITGTGTAKKELMLKEVYKKYNKDYDNNNVADAHGLAEMGLAMCSRKFDTFPKYQQDAIMGVLKTNGYVTHEALLECVTY